VGGDNSNDVGKSGLWPPTYHSTLRSTSLVPRQPLDSSVVTAVDWTMPLSEVV
jgi:hypothetical protein